MNQIQLPKIDSPFEAMGKGLQLRAMLTADQQAQYQQRQQQQAETDDREYRQAMQANPEGGAGLLSALAGKGMYKQHAAAQKADQDHRKGEAETRSKQIETAKRQLDIAGQAFGQVRLNPTPENAMSAIQYLVQNGVYSPEQGAQYAEQVRANPAGIKGLADQAFAAALDAKDQVLKIEKQDLGGTSVVQGVDPVSGQVRTLSTMAKTQTPDSIASVKQQDLNSRRTANTAAERLKFDKAQVEGTGPDASEAMIDAIGTGRMKPPTGYALRNPKILAMMERVSQKYPDYDATEYDGKQRAMRDFTTGRQGDAIRSFAVASDHLKQLDTLVDALNNKDLPLINKIGNKVAQQTGSVAPTNFDAAKGIVAKEVMKSIVAGGGGVEERQELSHLLDNAKTGPQLKGVIKTYLHLMEAQRDGLKRQYKVSTGRDDADTRFNYEQNAAPAPGGVVDFGSLK